MDKLSRDAKTVLTNLYKEFTSRRKLDISVDDASYFGSTDSIQSDFLPKMSIEDVNHSLLELESEGYLDTDLGDDKVLQCKLTPKAIRDCETIKKDIVKEAVSDLKDISSVLKS